MYCKQRAKVARTYFISCKTQAGRALSQLHPSRLLVMSNAAIQSTCPTIPLSQPHKTFPLFSMRRISLLANLLADPGFFFESTMGTNLRWKFINTTQTSYCFLSCLPQLNVNNSIKISGTQLIAMQSQLQTQMFSVNGPLKELTISTANRLLELHYLCAQTSLQETTWSNWLEPR